MASVWAPILNELVAKLKAELKVPLMADVATFTQGVKAVEELGFELVSTTLSGYTKETFNNGHADFQLVEQLFRRFAVPIFARGVYGARKMSHAPLIAGLILCWLGPRLPE